MRVALVVGVADIDGSTFDIPTRSGFFVPPRDQLRPVQAWEGLPAREGGTLRPQERGGLLSGERVSPGGFV